ncbi:MAG: hypothetical protein QXY26_09540 [Ignisphaera sp.]
MVMSTRALVNEDLLNTIVRIAKEKNGQIYIPSNAIGGLGELKASSTTSIEELVSTFTKNPKS